tara:strand:- start:1010 stop:1291 length:282 start_codon:yes stop_codon:yes gene_type:complete
MRSDKQPEPTNTDVYGKLIEVGKRVAFNYQGSVRLGTILKLHISVWKKDKRRTSSIGGLGERYWNESFELHIQGDGIEKFSKIKNPDSFVIID